MVYKNSQALIIVSWDATNIRVQFNSIVSSTLTKVGDDPAITKQSGTTPKVYVSPSLTKVLVSYQTGASAWATTFFQFDYSTGTGFAAVLTKVTLPTEIASGNLDYDISDNFLYARQIDADATSKDYNHWGYSVVGSTFVPLITKTNVPT